MKHLVLKILFLFSLFGTLNSLNATPWPQNRPTNVFIFKIDDTIDPRMNRRVDLALNQAKRDSADLIIIEMDTYGGAVNDADDIRTRLLNLDRPVYVFIDKDAASAGALISIACDSIYMAPGASIGAATVVTGEGKAAPDKYQSYMRSVMRTTAEARGRDPRIAEAMVDQNIQIDSISQEGKVITFTTSEAIKYGFCEAQEKDIEGILTRVGIKDYKIQRFELSSSEKIISIFLNPFVSGILVMIILGGLYFELQSPGVGFPLLAAVIALVLYFVPYYLNGLAANWEMVIFFIGLALLAVEIFVIPGFGVAGFAGITLIVSSLILVMLDNDLFDFSYVSGEDITRATASILGAMVSAIVMASILGAKAKKIASFSKLSLEDTQDRKQGYTANFKNKSMVGVKGKVYSRLRPSGKIMIDGELYDAYSRGEFIDKNDEVVVIGESGNSLQVKNID
ncbi:hypothetical protein FUAX_31710 [Fulvitalea axinellae]|uniref:Membrane-bound serine protease (ClpP class) n=1 Tax=Fulvitalea axinellae TaxID=1182444 RepID=A0AAU9CEY2_9BACT|nr:hypothetical protein FUAX_31710 [Fulvitalea axinellae]